jgi:hypothetical protein
MRSQDGKLFYAWYYAGVVLAKRLPDDYDFLETFTSRGQMTCCVCLSSAASADHY